MSSVPSRPLSLAVLSVGILLTAGCETPPELAVDRGTFIQVYVELRIAALDTDDATIPAAERDRILARHGIDQEDLFEFIRVHGVDPSYMHAVWEEIEDRLNSDSIPGVEPPTPG